MRKLFIISGFIFLLSCAGKQDELTEMVNTLDSELKQTDTLFVNLQRNPDDSILTSMDNTLGRIKSVLSDTMSADTEKILEDFLELQSSLRDYSSGIDTLAKEINYSRFQVDALKKDAAQGSPDFSAFELHAAKELTAIQMIQRNIDKMDKWFDSAQGTFITANELLQQKITADSILNIH